MALKWYVVHTYSGFEFKVKQMLEDKIRNANMQQYFGEILVPVEKVSEENKEGKRKSRPSKFYPGYILVQMDMNEKTWHLVRSTPKVTGFVGNSINPPAVPESEIQRVMEQMADGTISKKARIKFEEGESVRIIDGPFNNFTGVIDNINTEKGKVRVLISIFGRSTPVELDYNQIEKV
jgi:transcriptional antiterminator NusG